jgi:CRP-like cAMP-binding protein
MDLRAVLHRISGPAISAAEEAFWAAWKIKHVTSGQTLTRQGDPEQGEYVLLDGTLTSVIWDPDGKEICNDFFVGPCVLTPNIARTRMQLSLVTIMARSDAVLARIDTDQLTDWMIASEPVRLWANGILRETLSRKAEREWCLAAFGGAERLAWFREGFPGYEDRFTHSLIASFLGMTPVTLSRLRHAVKR